MALRSLENRMIYHPEVTPRRTVAVPGGPGEVEDVFFRTSDGLRLHAWLAGDPSTGPVLLYCHGNAGDIADRTSLLLELVGEGLGVLMFDYRGYGTSEGSPDERGLYEDALAAYGFLVEDRGVDPGRIVAHGQSLGGAVAIDLASKKRVAGIVIESSFTSMRDMTRVVFGPLPLHLVTRSRFDSAAKVSGLGMPKLFMHGDLDDLIPYEMGVRLYEAAAEPKRFLRMEGADHNSGPLVMGDSYYDAIGGFAREATGGGPVSP